MLSYGELGCYNFKTPEGKNCSVRVEYIVLTTGGIDNLKTLSVGWKEKGLYHKLRRLLGWLAVSAHAHLNSFDSRSPFRKPA